MTNEHKTELKNLIVYLDLHKMDKENILSNKGFRVLMDLDNYFAKFDDCNYRRQLAAEIFDLIDKS